MTRLRTDHFQHKVHTNPFTSSLVAHKPAEIRDFTEEKYLPLRENEDQTFVPRDEAKSDNILGDEAKSDNILGDSDILRLTDESSIYGFEAGDLSGIQISVGMMNCCSCSRSWESCSATKQAASLNKHDNVHFGLCPAEVFFANNVIFFVGKILLSNFRLHIHACAMRQLGTM